MNTVRSDDLTSGFLAFSGKCPAVRDDSVRIKTHNERSDDASAATMNLRKKSTILGIIIPIYLATTHAVHGESRVTLGRAVYGLFSVMNSKFYGPGAELASKHVNCVFLGRSSLRKFYCILDAVCFRLKE